MPATDVATDSATLVDLSAGWRQRWDGAQAFWFARPDNVGDALAHSAVALRTARELSPSPCRAATLGLRLDW